MLFSTSMYVFLISVSTISIVDISQSLGNDTVSDFVIAITTLLSFCKGISNGILWYY